MSLKVPKKKIPLTLFFVGGNKISGNIFLSHQSPIRLGEELVIDLLNNREPFFPLETGETSSIRIINKKTIISISTPENIEAEEELGKKQTITILLTDGQKVTGELIIDQPEYKSRVLDFLNAQEGRFFRLQAESETFYININYVGQVIPT